MQLRSDLGDMGVYAMSHWVLEYVQENKRISSIKADLVRYAPIHSYTPSFYTLLYTFILYTPIHSYYTPITLLLHSYTLIYPFILYTC